MRDHAHPAVPTRAALTVALVQGLFVTSWTVYAIYLPRLLAEAGISAAWVPWILMIDQLVFMVADVATGMAMDRMRRLLRRLGPWIVGVTAVSCLAFLMLPLVARLDGLATVLLPALLAVWAITSSALRAPPWVLLGRYAAKPALPWLNALAMIGPVAGSALAPFLGVVLKQMDARLPFALSSLTLLATTANLVHVERALARQPAASSPTSPLPPPQIPPQTPPPTPRVLGPGHATWMLGILLMAAAFQTHLSLNTAAQYLRLVGTQAALEWLMPLFWVGFGAAMLPAGTLCKRHGALPVLAWAALPGVVSAVAAAQATTLPQLITAQLVAGGAWGAMLVAIYTSATERGRTGREGLALGTMFAMLALATLVRMGVVLAGVPQSTALAPLLAWLPVVLWAAGGALIGALVWREHRPARRPTAQA